MRTKSLDQLALLQKNPANIRNICILAHVDHGKTTLADALVASNGIISHRMSGKMRYMDSREDEQERGITMKSSAITLFFEHDEKQHLINLIDSPGHVDFSSEVSTAVRLCDGAIVLVDVVEGVCPQTHAVLRQAWLENIKPILVLNKIDRLVLELKMSPLEAYFHLQQILTQMNLLTNELFTSEAMAKTSDNVDQYKRCHSTDDGTQVYDWTALEDEDEAMERKNIYFSPDCDNIVFTSAYDGWGFTMSHFADMWSQKLGISNNVLRKTLWGDYYLNNKSKRILKGAQSKGKKPLFVQFVLEQIWSLYDAVVITKDKEKIEKIVNSLKVKILPRDSRNADPRVHLQAIASQWLPVSKAVLDVVIDCLPSPLQITEEKVEKLMCRQGRRFDSLPEKTQSLKKDFIACNPSSESPVIIFVSKMFPVERRLLPQNKPRPLTEEELQIRRDIVRKRHADNMNKLNSEDNKENVDVSSIKAKTDKETSDKVQSEIIQPSIVIKEVEQVADQSDHVFIAFARIFSGTVKKGSELYVLGPKYDPAVALEKGEEEVRLKAGATLHELSSTNHITKVTVQDLYMFMGREVEVIDEVPAGNVLGIGGVAEHILKSATISSSIACPPFTDMAFDTEPIVRVAVEPVHPGDMMKLTQGLKLLNQADPCVEVMVQETGEHIIVTAGEVHLQRCIEDLQKRYAKIEVNVSSHIVPFRETIIIPPKVDMVNEAIQDQNQLIKSVIEGEDKSLDNGAVLIHTSNKKCVLHVRAVPLPTAVTDLLISNTALLKTLDKHTTAKLDEMDDDVKLNVATLESLRELKEQLKAEFVKSGQFWEKAIDEIWSFGPRRCGPNILLNRVSAYKRQTIWSCLEVSSDDDMTCRSFDSSIVNGFQMSTLSGPLCDEPMQGVCFIVEKWEYLRDEPAPPKSRRQAKQQKWYAAKRQAEKLKLREAGMLDSDSDEDDFHVRKDKQAAFGPFSGQLMSCAKEGCRRSYQAQPQRLSVAMYKCTIQATNEVLGKLYAVLSKRHGRVLAEDLKEGTQVFNVEATLPVIESFGFAQEMRKRTSGLASPQLKFSHWEVLDIDPFWTPSTEEEYLHFGEKADSENRARVYMNSVRKRKGLKVDEKIVEHAEKQRTLTRNK